MTDPRPRSFVLVAGLVLIGGTIVFFSPRSVMIVLQWVVGGLAAVAALHVVRQNAPSVWWTSPFDREADRVDLTEVDEAAWIRARLGGRRVRIGDGEAAVPPETLRLLRPLIEECLSRAVGDLRAPSTPAALGGGLSPLTSAVLHSDPTMQPGWWGTVGPDEHGVAEIVHHVLDELEEIDTTAPSSKSSM